MNPSKLVEYVLVGAALLLVVSLVAGQVLGQPILLSYVETGSMSPTLEPGDGFVAVPMAVAGPVEPGDVVVFDAENLHGGGLVTHRVVFETDGGYITRGDANPTTDQDSVEPPVQDAQIVAKALQIGGHVVVVPKIGLLVVLVNGLLTGAQQRLAAAFGSRAFLGPQGLAYLLLVFGGLSYLASELLGGPSERDRERRVTRRDASTGTWVAVAVLTVLVVMFVTASMTVPGGAQEFGFVSSTSDSPGPSVVPSGGSETFVYRVPSNGVLPVVVFLEPASEGIEATPTTLYVPPNSVRESIVTIHAPAETGYYRRYLVEHRYLALLPRGVIVGLYAIHPWMPILVIDALVGVGFGGVSLAVVGQNRIRLRSRAVPVVERIRRWLD